MNKRSYWQSVYIGDDRSCEAVRSWFAPLCDGMTVQKAEILCDIETDKEKKIRADVLDAEGKRWRVERTRGRNFTISMKPVADVS